MDGETARSGEMAEYGEFLRALARGLVGDRHLAEDVVQETELRAISGSPRAGSARRAWLARVVSNLALDMRRRDAGRRARERRVARSEAVPSHVEVGERLAVQRRVLRAVEGLPESQRTVVYLRYYDGLPPRRIATRLQLPVETVKTRLRRALARLRGRLDEEHGSRGAWLPLLVPGFRTGLVPAGVAASVGLLGAIIVTKKLAVATVVVLVAVGAWISWPDGGGTSPAAPAAPSPDSQADAIPVESAASSVPHDAATSERHAVELDEETASALPWTGRLVDASTAEPVPHYLLLLRGETELPERVCSGSDGSFTSQDPYPFGLLSAEALDHEQLSLREAQILTTHHGADEPSATVPPLEVRVGPAYRLQLDLPEGRTVGDFEGYLEPAPYSSPVIGTAVAPLREEGGWWVRFGPRASHLPGNPPWQLTIRSHDGFWRGTAGVPSVVGVLPELVPIVLRHTGRLVGTVVDEAGAAVNPLDWIKVRPVGAPDGRQRYNGRAEEPEGEFEIPYVEPGRYEVRIDPLRYTPFRAEVDVLPGETTTLGVALVKRPGLGTVRGRLQSRSGRYRFEGDVISIQHTTKPSNYFVARPETQEIDGRTEARCVFPDVPPGEYRVGVFSDTELEWSPTELIVRPEQAEFLLVCEDEVRARDYAFRAQDAATGESLLHFTVSLQVEKDGEEHITIRRSEAGAIRFSGVPEHLDVSWMLVAKGYAPVWGIGGGLRRCRLLRPIDGVARAGLGRRIPRAQSGWRARAGSACLPRRKGPWCDRCRRKPPDRPRRPPDRGRCTTSRVGDDWSRDRSGDRRHQLPGRKRAGAARSPRLDRRPG